MIKLTNKPKTFIEIKVSKKGIDYVINEFDLTPNQALHVTELLNILQKKIFNVMFGGTTHDD